MLAGSFALNGIEHLKKNEEALEKVYKGMKPGTTITYKVRRGDEELTVDIEPERRCDLPEAPITLIAKQLVASPARHHVDVVVPVSIEIHDTHTGMAIERRQAEELVRLLRRQRQAVARLDQREPAEHAQRGAGVADSIGQHRDRPSRAETLVAPESPAFGAVLFASVILGRCGGLPRLELRCRVASGTPPDGVARNLHQCGAFVDHGR